MKSLQSYRSRISQFSMVLNIFPSPTFMPLHKKLFTYWKCSSQLTLVDSFSRLVTMISHRQFFSIISNVHPYQIIRITFLIQLNRDYFESWHFHWMHYRISFNYSWKSDKNTVGPREINGKAFRINKNANNINFGWLSYFVWHATICNHVAINIILNCTRFIFDVSVSVSLFCKML